MPKPTIQYRSSPQTDAALCGAPRKFFPVPQIEDLCYGLEQDFEQLNSSVVALALNTPHPTDATCFLQAESNIEDKGALIAHWTRRYFQIPPSWDDWENVSHTFPQTPGFLAQREGFTGVLGRNPYTPINGVTCRVHRDYFMVGAGRTYANEGAIPLIPTQTYVGALNPQFFWDPPTVVPAAGINLVTGVTQIAVNQPDGSYISVTVPQVTDYLATVPSKETYFGWVTNAAAYGWGSGYDDGSGNWQASGQPAVVNPGQIVISCKPERLMGNLWARVTRYVLAL